MRLQPHQPVAHRGPHRLRVALGHEVGRVQLTHVEAGSGTRAVNRPAGHQPVPARADVEHGQPGDVRGIRSPKPDNLADACREHRRQNCGDRCREVVDERVGRAPHIHWEAGTLAIDVTPNRGIDLVVETDEGSVQVVGTAFAVTRDALGTHVSVDRGHVRVSCVAGTERALGAGDETTCLPLRAAAWLGRAQALLVAGQPTDDVLDAITHGLALAAPADPASGELVALRIRVLVDAGRYPEALAAAYAYLASGAATRRGEVEALAAELRGRP